MAKSDRMPLARPAMRIHGRVATILRDGVAGALLLLALGAASHSAGAAAMKNVHPLPMATLQKWSEAMRGASRPGTGCYAATYPAVKWTRIACAGAPPKNAHAAPSPAPGNYGAADNIVQATTPNVITSATGTIFDVANVQSETAAGGLRPGASNVYSFQLNTNYFPITSTAVCTAPSGVQPGQPVCQGFVQFVFENGQLVNGVLSSYVFIEYVLNNYLNNHSNCPTGWGPNQGSCYFGTKSAPVPVQNFTDGAGFILTGEIVGGKHAVTFTTATGQMVTSIPPDGTLLDLSAWSQAQFNVFGDFNGGTANFSPGSTMQVQTTVSPQTADVTCTKNSLTAETANIAAASDCALLAGKSGIGFVQGVNPVVARISPTSGGLEGGTLINVYGQYFSKEALVYFGGELAGSGGTYIPANCDTNVHCTFSSPPGATVGDMKVVQVATLAFGKPGLFSPVAPQTMFTYGAPDPIPSGTMNPSNGPVDGGTVVTVTGSNFSTAPGGTRIDFSFQGLDALATNVSCVSTTQCTMTTPPVSAPKVNNSAAAVRVTVNGVTGSLGQFAYPNPVQPPPFCVQCIQSGGMCVLVNGKRVCKGTLQ